MSRAGTDSFGEHHIREAQETLMNRHLCDSPSGVLVLVVHPASERPCKRGRWSIRRPILTHGLSFLVERKSTKYPARMICIAPPSPPDALACEKNPMRCPRGPQLSPSASATMSLLVRSRNGNGLDTFFSSSANRRPNPRFCVLVLVFLVWSLDGPASDRVSTM